ncbi:MAG: FAD-dependent oxidoreductase [Anaerolineales bacterium]|nr:FAD-dependent oxidoreductase [Anaerolineales bacterium]
MQSHARLVIIGAGIAGCSTAYHLAQLGWRDMMVVDQGPLFHTGGSTSHAPGGLTLITSSRMMTEFAQYGLPLYARLEVDGRKGANLLGSVEVARSAARWQELKRRHGWGQAFGVDCHLMTPAETKAKVPLLDETTIVGGLFTHGAGIGAPVVAAEAMARAAMAQGAAVFHGHTRVTGIEKSGRRVTAVVTDQGRIETETVLICAGIWGPLVGRLAGITVPLMPMEHQYAKLGPIPELAATGVEISMPIVRVHDHLMYCRQFGPLFGIGNYQHVPLPVAPEAIRTAQNDQDEPSKNLFTPEHFREPLEQVAEVFPMVRGRPIAEAFNGMFSFTPDGMPLLGPHPDVDGLWLAEAVWITHGGGVGKALAEWMTQGYPELDLREADISRFHKHALTPSYIRVRGDEAYKNVHVISHPAEPLARPRGLRRTPFYERYAAQQANFIEFGGFERAAWCETNLGIEEPDLPPRSGWAARYWSPVQAAEHLRTRAAAALFDMSTFTKIDVEGPDALALVQWVFTNQMDVPVGKVVYTLMLDFNGGMRSDMTVVRLGPDHFRVLSGAGAGPRDLAWLRRQAAAKGCHVRLTDLTSLYGALGLWGPKARAILAGVAEEDVSDAAFPYYTARPITLGAAGCLALRVSYVGELGWEIYVPVDFALHVWDLLWEAGRPHGLIAAGTGAMDSLRIERGFRRLGFDMDANYNPFEAGMGHVLRFKKGDFIGRAALLKVKDQPLARTLACLALDRPGDVVLGREPIFAAGRVAGWVSSANTGYSVSQHLAYAYLPPALAQPGQKLEIEYFGERLPATVVAEPVFDPEGKRVRA